MKRLVLLSLLVLLAAGCKRGNSIDAGQPTPVELEAATILAPSSNAMTRTALREETGTYNVYWELADSIGVFSEGTDNAKFTLNEKGGGTVAFQGATIGAPQYAYYPYASTAGADPTAVALTLPADQTQAAPAGLPATRQPNMAYDVKVGIQTGEPTSAGYPFVFTQKLSLIHFVITPNATLDGEALQSISLQVAGKRLAGDYTLDVTAAGNAPVFGVGASDLVTLAFADTPALTAGTPVDGWMFINPDIAADETLTIRIVTDNYRVTTLSATASAAFARGALYEVAMDIDALLDASKVSLTLIRTWDELASAPGLYALTPSSVTPVHGYARFEDQYGYKTSGGNYSFTVQGLRTGKLTRLTAASADLANDAAFDATLYTIHGTDGAVSTLGSWQVVKRASGAVMDTLWVEKADHTQGFMLLKED
jgi:hypothetical protein